jgi:hypothetical protein
MFTLPAVSATSFNSKNDGRRRPIRVLSTGAQLETLDFRAEFGYSVPEFPRFSAPVQLVFSRVPVRFLFIQRGQRRSEPANSGTKQPLRSEPWLRRRNASRASAKAAGCDRASVTLGRRFGSLRLWRPIWNPPVSCATSRSHIAAPSEWVRVVSGEHKQPEFRSPKENLRERSS